MNRDSFSELVEGFEALAAERLSDAEPCYQRIGAMKVKLVLPEDFDAPCLMTYMTISKAPMNRISVPQAVSQLSDQRF